MKEIVFLQKIQFASINIFFNVYNFNLKRDIIKYWMFTAQAVQSRNILADKIVLPIYMYNTLRYFLKFKCRGTHFWL